MTVCIGALANEGKNVVIAADRMLTRQFPPVEYEDQNNKKVFRLHDDFYLLVAGTVNHAIDIIEIARPRINETDTLEAKFEKMKLAYNEYRIRLIEDNILRKHGLTLAEFKAMQGKFLPQIVVNIQNEISKAQLAVDFILIGLHADGCLLRHLQNPGTLNNPLEYVAIGSGGLHAVQSLISNRFSKTYATEVAAYLVYEAKKQAEVTPGVGEMTDVIIFDVDGSGSFNKRELSDSEIKTLNTIYKKVNKRNLENIEKLLDKNGFMSGKVEPSGDRGHQKLSKEVQIKKNAEKGS